MGSQHLLPRPVLLLQAIHNKDTEIIPQAENKSGKDNIHDIELRSGNRHQPQDNHPADSHRRKSHQGQFDPSIGDQQSKEDKERRDIQYQVKVVVNGRHPFIGKIPAIKNHQSVITRKTVVNSPFILLIQTHLGNKHRQGIG